MDTVNSGEQRPDFGRLVARDGWVLVSLITIVVMWGFAIINMAGFSVSRGHSGSVSANASDWPVMLGLAVALTILGIAIIIWRMQFWKRAQSTTAFVLDIVPVRTDAGIGYELKYQYEVNGQTHQGKTSFGRNSSLKSAQSGDMFTVFFDPKKPQASRVVA